MHEVLWEIWYQKRNIHHRVAMDFNETPSSVFQRIAGEFQGTEKEFPQQILDPNTGREMPVQWDFSFRSRGKESRIQDNRSFAEQGVGEGSLLVARLRNIRANTIYIDGTAGLADEELAVAKSKMPIIFMALLLLLGGAGGAWYFMIYAPEQARKAPYSVNVGTEPKESEVSMLMDLKGTPRGKMKRFQLVKFKTPAKNVKVPKKAKIIYIAIIDKEKKLKEWRKGFTQQAWLKDQTDRKSPDGKVVKAPRKLIAINPKELTIPGFFPDELDKKPPPPKFLKLKVSTPKSLAVQYPRRWRRMRVGLDALHGGKVRGAVGFNGPPASQLTLKLALATAAHLKKAKRRGYRTYLTRKKQDKNPTEKKRARKVRWVKAAIQFDFAVGHKEFPVASKNTKKDGELRQYNDSVAGFKVFWSEKNRKAEKAKKLANCMAGSMLKAGFAVHRIGHPKPKPAQHPVRKFNGESKVLNGRAPAIRLVVGYTSHRDEEKLLMLDTTHKAIATAVENALVCFKK